MTGAYASMDVSTSAHDIDGDPNEMDNMVDKASMDDKQPRRHVSRPLLQSVLAKSSSVDLQLVAVR